MKKKIFIPIFAILIVVILAFYLGDIIVNSTSPKEHLFEMLSSLVICLGSVIKLVTADRTRKSLAFYEAHYADVLVKLFKILIGIAESCFVPFVFITRAVTAKRSNI